MFLKDKIVSDNLKLVKRRRKKRIAKTGNLLEHIEIENNKKQHARKQGKNNPNKTTSSSQD